MFTFELADCVELKVICVSVPSLASVTASSANFAVEILASVILAVVTAASVMPPVGIVVLLMCYSFGL